jgi:hypothetical protein
MAACATSLLALGAVAAPVQVGRSVLDVPDSVDAQSFALPAKSVDGDGNLVLERKIVRWTPAGTATPSVLLIEGITSGGSRFEWGDSCRAVKPGADVFVHRPFHSSRDQCVVAVGPVDLASFFASVHKDVAADPGWRPSGEGYFVRATLSISSGAHMNVNAYLPRPFAGGGWQGSVPAHDAEFPEHVAAWAMALQQQVESSVLSLSGKWQLPLIKQQ